MRWPARPQGPGVPLAAVWPPPASGGAGRWDRPRQPPVDTPFDCSIFATTPPAGSKNFVITVAWASVLPCSICEPYAAMMFQRAPPEVNGLGSSTCTPGLVRSSQVLIPFGLPLRTTNTTTELVTNPWVGPLVQLELTLPDFT